MTALVADDALASVTRLTTDLRKASATLGAHEARFVVDNYYALQKFRIRTENQLRALSATGEPNEVLLHFAKQFETLESTMQTALDKYSAGHPVGRWSRDQKGIGPVLAAGLLAHIDITQCPTVGHIWQFAGLNPNRVWLGTEAATKLVNDILPGKTSQPVDDVTLEMLAEALDRDWVRMKGSLFNRRKDGDTTKPITKGEVIKYAALRPWNGNLKTLCWKIGESFVKVSGNEEAFYGQVYRSRKSWEIIKNENGDYADQARHKLATMNFRDDTTAKAKYSEGKLPDAHIHARAKRYAVKLFLAHWHEVAYINEYGEKPPKPYVIEHLGHGHYIAPPGLTKAS